MVKFNNPNVSKCSRVLYRYRDGIETPENRYYWWFCDYLSDFIYLLDILLVKVRIRFVKNGLVEVKREVV